MSKRGRGGVSRKESRIIEDLVKEGGTSQDVSMDISPKQSSSSATPPPGFANVPHGYGTRQAKGLAQYGINVPLRSLPSPSRCARRVIPPPEEEFNTAAIANQAFDFEQQTGAAEQVHQLTRSHNYNLTEVLQFVSSKDDEEVNSTPNPFLVNVYGYRLKEEIAPLIQKIFARRYGDIAEDCTMKSVEIRSSFLETLCNIYQKVDMTNLLDITLSELNSMLNQVIDLEVAKVEVAWLRDRLKQISEAKNSLIAASSLKATKMKKLQEIQEKKRAMAYTKKELCLLNEKVKILEDEVSSGGIEVEEISQSYSKLKSKVDLFYGKPLLRDLL